MKEAINRSFHFGDLASLHMVETRLTARAEQMDFANIPKTADGRPDIAAFEAQRQEPSRDLLGEGQRRWLGEAMSQSKAAGRPWQILGNQVVMARVKGPNIEQMLPPAQVAQMIASLPADIQPQVEAAIQLFKLGLPFNLDSWDGYPAGRERLYETMKQAGVEPIVLAGDSHAFWVNDQATTAASVARSSSGPRPSPVRRPATWSAACRWAWRWKPPIPRSSSATRRPRAMSC